MNVEEVRHRRSVSLSASSDCRSYIVLALLAASGERGLSRNKRRNTDPSRPVSRRAGCPPAREPLLLPIRKLALSRKARALLLEEDAVLSATPAVTSVMRSAWLARREDKARGDTKNRAIVVTAECPHGKRTSIESKRLLVCRSHTGDHA